MDHAASPCRLIGLCVLALTMLAMDDGMMVKATEETVDLSPSLNEAQLGKREAALTDSCNALWPSHHSRWACRVRMRTGRGG